MKKIPELILSKKGNELLDMYKKMVNDGYKNDLFNIKNFKEFLKKAFAEHNIKTLLDYGSGRSNWKNNNFIKNKNISAIDFFDLDNVFHFEPTIPNSQKYSADCVLCFDVLEGLRQ